MLPLEWRLLYESTTEGTRLKRLGMTSDWRSFDAKGLRLRERGRKFWENVSDRNKTFLFELLDSVTNPLGDEIIAGFVDAIAISGACELAKERNGVLLSLLARDSELAMSADFWNCPIPLETYYSILDFLATNRDTSIPADHWLFFLFQTNRDELAGPVVERFATEVIEFSISRVLDPQRAGRLGPSCRTALSKHQPELLSFLKAEDHRNESNTLTFLAGLLDPHQGQVREYGLGPWVELAKTAPDVVLASPNGEASSFLLSLGFQSSHTDAMILVATCFEHVHAAARIDALDPLNYRAWKSLELDVPILPPSRNWDNCERLLRALIGRFVSNHWPREQFLKCVNRPATLRSVFYSCREVPGGKILSY